VLSRVTGVRSSPGRAQRSLARAGSAAAPLSRSSRSASWAIGRAFASRPGRGSVWAAFSRANARSSRRRRLAGPSHCAEQALHVLRMSPRQTSAAALHGGHSASAAASACAASSSSPHRTAISDSRPAGHSSRRASVGRCRAPPRRRPRVARSPPGSGPRSTPARPEAPPRARCRRRRPLALARKLTLSWDARSSGRRSGRSGGCADRERARSALRRPWPPAARRRRARWRCSPPRGDRSQPPAPRSRPPGWAAWSCRGAPGASVPGRARRRARAAVTDR
jgi:hypothetical protein